MLLCVRPSMVRAGAHENDAAEYPHHLQILPPVFPLELPTAFRGVYAYGLWV